MKTNHLLLAVLAAAITMPLLPVAEPVGQAPSTTVVYTYDASGNRINPTPNPTTGVVSVELLNTYEPIAIRMGLY